MGIIGAIKSRFGGNSGGVEDGGGQGQDASFSNKDLATYEPDPMLLARKSLDFIPNVQKGPDSTPTIVEAQPYQQQTLEERQKAALAARDSDNGTVRATVDEGNGKVQQPLNKPGGRRF